MASIEKMEQQLAALNEKRVALRKDIATAKRQEKAKQDAEKRKQEQAEALAFMAFCKANRIRNEETAPTIYEWVNQRMNSAKSGT